MEISSPDSAAPTCVRRSITDVGVDVILGVDGDGVVIDYPDLARRVTGQA